MSSITIPTIDLHLLRTGDKEELKNLENSAKTYGFCYLENHGISEELVKELRKVSSVFFKEKDNDFRMQYSAQKTNGQRGYTPPGKERATRDSVPDFKHFFQQGDMVGFIDVPDVPNFKVSMKYFKVMEKLGIELMQYYAVCAGLEKSYFDEVVGNSILRQIHYMKQENPIKSTAEAQRGGNVLGMCAEEH